MESRSWEKLAFLLALLNLQCFCPGFLAELQLPQTNVVAIQGQNLVLQAIYTGDVLTSGTIVWNYFATSSERITDFITVTIPHAPVINPAYVGRVGFVYKMPNNNMSIYLNNVVESDSGRYVCQLVLPNISVPPKELTLDVTVPPSMPVCELQGTPEVKSNVTLTCKSSGKPAPKYKWSRTSPTSEIFFSPALNEVTGILKLNNLSTNMSGKYECTASNSAGVAKCYINLEVITSSKAGVIAGATIGVLLGLILIILAIIFFWGRRKKETEDDLANDIKEDAQAPKRVSWARSGTGSEIISKNGTLSSVRSSPLPLDTHDNHHHQYPITYPTSDTASIITSSTSYRPQPAGISSTPEHTLPGYNNNVSVLSNPPAPISSNGGSLPRTGALQPPTSRYVPTPSGVSAANLSRMGGVPIMVPAQNQAGSLV
ncbi:endothelial cell adhesion molecule a [Clarias gariepinus]|uniref:endothelial cell adhesion molecule a n=1 Tax=Clarias gariepinus TaxID=13013 RepID=UPI00234CBEFE|nr:endothelial cell adhesion molecule a [Clarias gariepinus]